MKVKNIEIIHIKTGKDYLRGQRITIVYMNSKTYFIDHSRKVEGMINKPNLHHRSVLWNYLNDSHEVPDIDLEEFKKFEAEGYDKIFTDFSGLFGKLSYDGELGFGDEGW
jgi:hypothetical protein